MQRASTMTACLCCDKKLQQTLLPPSNAHHISWKWGRAANAQKVTFYQYTGQGELSDGGVFISV